MSQKIMLRQSCRDSHPLSPATGYLQDEAQLPKSPNLIEHI